MSVETILSGNKAVIVVTGRFVFAMHSEFRKAAQTILTQSGVTEIEIDLSQTDYLDSAGLGMLLLLHERAKKAGKQPIRIVGSGGRVRGVLDMCNFNQLFVLA